MLRWAITHLNGASDGNAMFHLIDTLGLTIDDVIRLDMKFALQSCISGQLASALMKESKLSSAQEIVRYIVKHIILNSHAVRSCFLFETEELVGCLLAKKLTNQFFLSDCTDDDIGAWIEVQGQLTWTCVTIGGGESICCLVLLLDHVNMLERLATTLLPRVIREVQDFNGVFMRFLHVTKLLLFSRPLPVRIPTRGSSALCDISLALNQTAHRSLSNIATMLAFKLLGRYEMASPEVHVFIRVLHWSVNTPYTYTEAEVSEMFYRTCKALSNKTPSEERAEYFSLLFQVLRLDLELRASQVHPSKKILWKKEVFSVIFSLMCVADEYWLQLGSSIIAQEIQDNVIRLSKWIDNEEDKVFVMKVFRKARNVCRKVKRKRLADLLKSKKTS